MADETKSAENLPPTPPPEPAAKKPLYEATDDRKFQWYMEKRKGYSSGARESYQRYDQTIATVSAGAIVLSITFLKDIGHTPTSLPWLVASWIAFLVAGGVGLWSLRTSADSDIQRLAALEAIRIGDDYTEFENKGTRLGELTVLLNKISIWAFMLAILLMMIFAYVNVSHLGGADCPPTAKAASEKAASQAPTSANAKPQKSLQPSVATTAPVSTSPKATPASLSRQAQ